MKKNKKQKQRKSKKYFFFCKLCNRKSPHTIYNISRKHGIRLECSDCGSLIRKNIEDLRAQEIQNAKK